MVQKSKKNKRINPLECLDDFMTLQEAAKKLGYTTEGIRIAQKRGQLKAVWKGRQWLIHRQEFERFGRKKK